MNTLVLAAEEGAINPVVPHTSEIILGLIAFLLLFFVIKKFVTPRFETLYAERAAKIEGGIEKAEQAQVQAQATLDEYKAQLAEARAEAARIRDDARIERALQAIPAGGVTVNDTLLHILQDSLPFGGVGASGMGHYHGQWGFETFSHRKAVLRRPSWLADSPVMRPPFSGWKQAVVRRLF